MYSKNLFVILLCLLSLPFRVYGMPTREDFEKAQRAIPASMTRLMSIRSQTNDPASGKLILTPKGEVAGSMEFDSAQNMLRLSLKNICGSAWVQVLDLEKTREAVPLFQEKVRARVHAGIYRIYKDLFYPGESEKNIINPFISELISNNLLTDLSTLRIEIEGDSLGGSLGQLAAGDCKFLLSEYGVEAPHIRILAYGAPCLFDSEGARLYDTYMGTENFLHLNFRGEHDPVVNTPLSTLQSIVSNGPIRAVLNIINTTFSASPELNFQDAAPVLSVCGVKFSEDLILPNVSVLALAQAILRISTFSETPDFPIGIPIVVRSSQDSLIPQMLQSLNLKKLSPLIKEVGRFHDLKKFYMTPHAGTQSRTERALIEHIRSNFLRGPAASARASSPP